MAFPFSVSAAVLQAGSGCSGQSMRHASFDGLSMEIPGGSMAQDEEVGFRFQAYLPRSLSEMGDGEPGPGPGPANADFKANGLLQKRAPKQTPSPPPRSLYSTVQASPLSRVAVIPREGFLAGSDGEASPQQVSPLVSAMRRPSFGQAPSSPKAGPPRSLTTRCRGEAPAARQVWRDAQLSGNTTPRRSTDNSPSSPILTRKPLFWTPTAPSNASPRVSPAPGSASPRVSPLSNHPRSSSRRLLDGAVVSPAQASARRRSRADVLNRVVEHALLLPPPTAAPRRAEPWTLVVPRSLAHPCVSGKIAAKVGRVRAKASRAMEFVMALCVIMCALCVMRMCAVDVCAPGSRALAQGLCK